VSRPRITPQQAATIGAFTFTAGLFVFAALYRSSFTSSSSLSQTLIFASFLGVAALGQTAVVLAGGMDLSVPWTVALGGVGLTLWTNSGMAPGVAIALLIAVGAAVGLVNGLGVTWLRVPPIVMTLAVGGILQAYLLKVGLGTGTSDAAPQVARDLATGTVLGVPTLGVVWAAIAIGAGWVLGRSALGRRVYAVGANEAAARLAGVRVARVRIATYMASGVGSIVAGMMLSGFLGRSYIGMGAPYLFGSIAAVAVGGASIFGGQGSYWGTVAGALTLTLLSSILSMFNLGQSALEISYGLVIIGGVVLGRVAGALAGPASRVRSEA
jgi:ribose transport system permease protein